MSSFKERMRSEDVLIGAMIETPEPDVAELMGTLGFDWFWIDMEHCPLDFKHVQTILQAIGKSEAASLVRVPWNDPVYIKRALDLWPTGVIVPWVNSRDEAVKAVSACKYPPEGIRGCGPRRPVWYRSFTEYVREANESVVIIVQIETVDALKNLSEILSVPGIDGTMVGPADLSASLGYLGYPDKPEVVEVIRHVAEMHRGTNVCPGIASNPKDAEKHIKLGFRLLNVSSDLGFMRMAAVETLKQIREFLNAR
ncbi:MAG: 2,4-dihydroxyhept-2-ene-1,7-dioic acid aldolase [Candidatus Brockarchaeota archaeon]|nr:2,4-dihydroxyhept-2-ene-1,7-dioic acid aldolase [Candidatus Brockarchaeota archaeon]